MRVRTVQSVECNFNAEGMPMFPEDVTADVPKLELPADLVAEVSRRNKKAPKDFRVDGWKPSLLERLRRLLGLA